MEAAAAAPTTAAAAGGAALNKGYVLFCAFPFRSY